MIGAAQRARRGLQSRQAGARVAGMQATMNRHDVDRLALPGERQRENLRERVRHLLDARWPAEGAAYRAGQPAAVAALWQALADERIAALGFRPAAAGLREAAIVVEEVGRAGCAIPIVGHLLGNLVLARARGSDQPLVDVHVRERLHGGAMRMTIAFAGEPPDADGAVQCEDGHASGLLRSVDAALQATHLLLCVTGGLLVADLGGPGVSVIDPDGCPGASCALVRLEHVAIDLFPLPANTVTDLRLLSRLLLTARENGSGRHERDGARAAVACAAEAFDFGLPHWREQAAAAVACGASAPAQGGYSTVTGTRCASAHISS
jgi:hypothetical protein